ncbi:TIGR02270 family protein [Myxococcus sp. AM010]|uniref:TIGR02270 family protein n=1 Tax=Myxococcus sp. AM010 TaxID=2745138 RepID=UPI0015963AA5|nr:TIGR02270 family protein [Myxococcus sp. AM010]NVJ16896.1 TIGR02270 family protein [Myxococcus sp. AM010]
MHLRTDIILNWGRYEEHLDEAAFQWGQWERTLTASDQLLLEAAEAEEQLLARLDALVLGGERVAIRLLEPALASDEPERLSTAVFTLLGGDWSKSADAVLTLVENATPTALEAVRRALEVLEPQTLPAWLPSLLDKAPPLQALALSAMGTHLIAPPAPLARWVTAKETSVATAALQAATRLRTRIEWPLLKQAISSHEPQTRDAALIAALLSGHTETWRICRDMVVARHPGQTLPLLLLSLGAGPSGSTLLSPLADEPQSRADAVWALGFNGYVTAAETCLKYLDDDNVAPLAAEAFSAITGLVLAKPFVEDKAESEDEASDEGNGTAPTIHRPPGTGLPRPSTDDIRGWWAKNQKQFNPAVRYLRGQPWTPAAFLQGLWAEPMRRRHVLALEATLRSQGAFQLQTQAFTRRQFIGLTSLREAPPTLTSRPLAEGLFS